MNITLDIYYNINEKEITEKIVTKVYMLRKVKKLHKIIFIILHTKHYLKLNLYHIERLYLSQILL